MTDLATMGTVERMERALQLIQRNRSATGAIRILAAKGLGEFTFSPNIEALDDEDVRFRSEHPCALKTAHKGHRYGEYQDAGMLLGFTCPGVKQPNLLPESERHCDHGHACPRNRIEYKGGN